MEKIRFMLKGDIKITWSIALLQLNTYKVFDEFEIAILNCSVLKNEYRYFLLTSHSFGNWLILWWFWTHGSYAQSSKLQLLLHPCSHEIKIWVLISLLSFTPTGAFQLSIHPLISPKSLPFLTALPSIATTHPYHPLLAPADLCHLGEKKMVQDSQKGRNGRGIGGWECWSRGGCSEAGEGFAPYLMMERSSHNNHNKDYWNCCC